MTMSSSLRSRLYAGASNVNISSLNTQLNARSNSESDPHQPKCTGTEFTDSVVLNLKMVMLGPRPEMRVLIQKQGATPSQKLSAFVPATSRGNGSNISNSQLTLDIARSVPTAFLGPLLALLHENVAFDTHSKLARLHNMKFINNMNFTVHRFIRIRQQTTKSNVLSLRPSSLEKCLTVLAFLMKFRCTSFSVVFGAGVAYQIEHLEFSVQTAAALWDAFFVPPAVGSFTLSAANKDPTISEELSHKGSRIYLL